MSIATSLRLRPTAAAARLATCATVAALLGALVAPAANASSHREAPFITTQPKVDGTDFYMFNSYEGVAANGSGGRAGFVTLIANYVPLQDPYGGPNYFSLDPNALSRRRQRADTADPAGRGQCPQRCQPERQRNL